MQNYPLTLTFALMSATPKMTVTDAAGKAVLMHIDLSRPLGALTNITGFDIAMSLDDDHKHAEFAAALTIIFQGTALLQIN